MFPIPSFSYIKIAGIVAVLAVCFFGYLYVKGIQNENSKLKVENSNLQIVVDSKVKEIQQINQVKAMVENENKVLRDREKEKQQRLIEMNKLLNDPKRNDDLKKMRSTDANKLLDTLNSSQKCIWGNLENSTDCIVKEEK